jgi:hypothetical protein
MNTTYHVLNGHSLGYVQEAAPGIFGVLHGDPLSGGYDEKNGPVALCPGDQLREATLADFERFRVSPVGHVVRIY